MTTGSNKLDKYAKQVKRGNEFHSKFSNALLEHLTRRSLDYKVETIAGGFRVIFNGLEADFTYQAEGDFFRIVHDTKTSAAQYASSSSGFKGLVERWDGTIVDADLAKLSSELINPVLESQIGSGYNLDNLI